MNLTPDPNLASSTPFNALTPEEAAAQRRAEEKAVLDAKMALLPEYGDEAFPRRPKLARATARKASARARGMEPAVAGEASADAEDAVAAPGSVVAGGCLGGMAGNVALGFVLLALQRAGIALYGPGVLAVVVALVVLALLVGTWPRRVWLAAGGFLLGLVLCFGALFLFVRPALDPASERSIPATTSPGGAPPPVPSSDGMQPS